ncbi:hypothetical protein I6A84_28945, partial [Frankia sp. CNm7]|uniref:hypothetical protein n=1 Tax=Frankia nepalensis TaxID=1836974 RepID=UPI001932B076
MTLRQFCALLIRHWRVVLPGLIVTVVLCGVGLKAIPPAYQAEATMVMLPSSAPPAPTNLNAPPPERTNPYLSFNASLRVAADVLGRSVSDQETAQALAKKGATAAYSVEVALDSPGPLVKIVAESSDSAAVARTVDLVVAEVERRLQALQLAAGAPQDTFITTALVTQTPPAAGYKKVIEVVGLLFVAGFLVTSAAAILVERRSRRRPARTAAEVAAERRGGPRAAGRRPPPR